MSGLPVTSDDVVPQKTSILKKPIDMEELRALIQQKSRPSDHAP